MPFLSEKKIGALPHLIAKVVTKELKPSTFVDAEQVKQAAHAVLHCRNSYSPGVAKTFTERSLNLALFAYLYSRYPATSREHRIAIGNGPKPKRVDFRIGGTNPVLVEFAYRKPGQAKQPLQGEANSAELRKLGRFPNSVAKSRILLLVDGSKDFIARNKLEPTYKGVNRGQGGKAVIHTVTVVYVHKDGDYRFSWRP